MWSILFIIIKLSPVLLIKSIISIHFSLQSKANYLKTKSWNITFCMSKIIIRLLASKSRIYEKKVFFRWTVFTEMKFTNIKLIILFGRCTMLYNHHFYLVPKYFHHYQRRPCIYYASLCIPPSPESLATT